MLSPEQEEIVAWFETGVARGARHANLAVRARAGTGKTFTILAGVQRAPETRAPHVTLLAAFNKTIAGELQARVGGNPRIHAKTLHALGCRFVFAQRPKAKVDESGRRARLLAQAALNTQTADRVCDAVAKLHTKAREVVPFARDARDLQWLIYRFNIEIPDTTSARFVCDAALRAMTIAREDHGTLSETFDFADMIYLPLVCDWTRRMYSLVVIDEAQDMTAAQLELARRVAYTNGRIAIVGDDRQAIYSFRGADADGFGRLRLELQAVELPLLVTRRCARDIVTAAQAIVPDIAALPEAPRGIVRKIDKAALAAQVQEGDFVLSRTNGPLIRVALALLKRDLCARVRGKDVGRQAQALLRALDPATTAEIPALVAGWAVIERSRAQGLLPDVQEARLDAIEDQVAVLTELAAGCADVAAVRRRIDLLFDDDAVGATVVTCSSVHRAKGLEAARVFLLEGTFRGSGHEGEEANIRYVAITRARSELVWVGGYERARDAA